MVTAKKIEETTYKIKNKFKLKSFTCEDQKGNFSYQRRQYSYPKLTFKTFGPKKNLMTKDPDP